jgi:hypothetical protein
MAPRVNVGKLKVAKKRVGTSIKERPPQDSRERVLLHEMVSLSKQAKK